MDAALPSSCSLVPFCSLILFGRRVQGRIKEALDEEIDRDFIEEFTLDKSPKRDLSPESMEKVVDWLEDDLKDDHPIQRLDGLRNLKT